MQSHRWGEFISLWRPLGALFLILTWHYNRIVQGWVKSEYNQQSTHLNGYPRARETLAGSSSQFSLLRRPQQNASFTVGTTAHNVERQLHGYGVNSLENKSVFSARFSGCMQFSSSVINNAISITFPQKKRPQVFIYVLSWFFYWLFISSLGVSKPHYEVLKIPL